jgi:transcriptional regulator with XRE-family HTH domain
MTEIDTLNILPLDARVSLKEEIRRDLFSDKKTVAKRLGISVVQVEKWLKGINNPSLEQLKLMGVNLSNLWEFIESFNLEGGRYKVKLQKKLDLEECFWILGISEGDGVNRKRVVGVTNQEKEIISQFIRKVTRMGINELRLAIKVNSLDEVDISQVSQVFGIPKEKIKVALSSFKTNKPIFQVFTPSRLIRRMFDKLLEMIENRPQEFNLNKFLQGFFDAEGCITNKSVKITQKTINGGMKRMKFVSQILTSLGIAHSFLVDKNNVITIRLKGGKSNLDNLKRFKKLVGFSHPEKAHKLDELIKSLDGLPELIT